jgi:hypothetical protein
VPDVNATASIQQRLDENGLRPAEHYLDSGYPSADLIHAAAEQGTTMVTPALLDHSPQVRAADGFDKSAFTIGWKAGSSVGEGDMRGVHGPPPVLGGLDARWIQCPARPAPAPPTHDRRISRSGRLLAELGDPAP